jgi:hypothetical protein
VNSASRTVGVEGVEFGPIIQILKVSAGMGGRIRVKEIAVAQKWVMEHEEPGRRHVAKTLNGLAHIVQAMV